MIVYGGTSMSLSAAAIGCCRTLFSMVSHSPWKNTSKSSSLFRSPIPRRVKPMAMAMDSSSISTLASEEEEKSKDKPWLLVGLGNPGKRYTATRHNVGFELIDYIAEAESIPMNTVSFKASFGKGYIGDVPVMLAKPQTFMNASGESVGAIVSYYKIPLNQVLVMFDDMDLPFAKLRLLPKGGHGGHNGMRSIINHFKGSKDFPRLRIGIGRPPGKMDPASFVLRPFNRDERQEDSKRSIHSCDEISKVALNLILVERIGGFVEIGLKAEMGSGQARGDGVS